MTNTQWMFVFGIGCVFFGASAGTLWRMGRDTQTPERQQMQRMLYRTSAFGLFILGVPSLLFILNRFFSGELFSRVAPIYLIVIGLLGMLVYIWFFRDFIPSLPLLGPNMYPYWWVTRLLTIFSGFSIFFLYEGLYLSATRLFVSADRPLIGIVILFFVGVAAAICISYLRRITKRYRGQRSGRK